MLKYVILCLLFLTGPVHESFMGLEYLPEKELFKVFIKLSYKDFILDYRNSVNDDQPFDASGKIDTSVILVRKYLNYKVQIIEDGTRLKAILNDVEFSDGELKLNLVYQKNKNSKNLLIRNTILCDVYQNQSNFMIFKHGNHEEGVIFTRDKPEKLFRLK
jgi:hypothetical protein